MQEKIPSPDICQFLSISGFRLLLSALVSLTFHPVAAWEKINIPNLLNAFPFTPEGIAIGGLILIGCPVYSL